MESSWAMLLIQVKNRCNVPKHCKRSSFSCGDMLPTRAFAGDCFSEIQLKQLDQRCIRVYMQLGASKPSAHCEPTGRNGGSTPPLEIFGISSRCLSKPVQHALALMVNGRINLDTYFDNQIDDQATSGYPDEPCHELQQGVTRQAWPLLVNRSETTETGEVTDNVLMAVC